MGVPYRNILNARSRPGRLRRYLGGEAASWVLSEEHRPGAPVLPDGRGEVVVLFETVAELRKEHEGRPSVFPAGFALPFVWVKGAEGDGGLPDGMGEVVVSVRREVGRALGRDLEEWSLRALVEVNLPLTCGSAWAPLAAALWLACEGGTPRSRVWATGAWNAQTGSVTQVGGVRAKLAALAALTTEPGVLFMPAANRDALESEGVPLPEHIARRHYPVEARSLAEALSEHLTELAVPPGRAQPLEERLTYANKGWLHRDARRRYYLDALVDDLAVQLRAGGWAPAPRRALINLGMSFDQAALALRALAWGEEPLEALVLHTNVSGRVLKPLREHLAGVPARLTPCDVSAVHEEGAEAARVLDRLVRWLLEEPDPRARVVDVTGGTGAMSILGYEASVRAEARAIYIQHRPDEERSVFFGRERLVRLGWRA